MKKTFRNYIGIWAVLLVLFNVIAFVSVGWAGLEKYTASFWIGYAGILLAFAGQLACAWKVFREENLQKCFYNISILRISYHGLIWSFVIGGACMVLSPLPYWVGVILCAIVLAVTAIAVLKADTAADLVGKVDEKVKAQTAFIRLLTVDAENLLSCAKTEEAKAACKKVYEAARYSDPMSNGSLASVENKITIKFSEFSNAVVADDSSVLSEVANEIVILLTERDKKCRLLK